VRAGFIVLPLRALLRKQGLCADAGHFVAFSASPRSSCQAEPLSAPRSSCRDLPGRLMPEGSWRLGKLSGVPPVAIFIVPAEMIESAVVTDNPELISIQPAGKKDPATHLEPAGSGRV